MWVSPKTAKNFAPAEQRNGALGLEFSNLWCKEGVHTLGKGRQEKLRCLRSYTEKFRFYSKLGSLWMFYARVWWFILYVKLTGLRNAQIGSKTVFMSVSARVFLEEISLWIGDLSKTDSLPQCGWALSNILKAWIQAKEGGMTLHSLSLLELRHLSSFALRHHHSRFLGLWTQTRVYTIIPILTVAWILRPSYLSIKLRITPTFLVLQLTDGRS